MNSGAQSAHKPPISERSRRLFEVACLGCRIEKKKVRKRCGNPSRRRPPYIIFFVYVVGRGRITSMQSFAKVVTMKIFKR